MARVWKKERPKHVWFCYDEEDMDIGQWKYIEYEHVPAYCLYCKHQGQVIKVWTVRVMDEEFLQRKELESGRKDMSNEGKHSGACDQK